MSEQEKKDKKFGMIASGVIHASLVLIFLFLVAWREPDPPIPEYGIELNLGFQEEGGGDTEREAEALVEDTAEEEMPDAPEETQQEEITEEEVVEETTPPVTETKTETQETTEVKEEAKEVVKDPVTTEESEVVVEEKKEETEEKKEEATVEKKEEEKKPVEKPKPPLDIRAVMGGKKTDTANTEQSSNNQGDQRASMGNQGDKDGQKSTDGLSKDGADIGGVSLSLDGWKWSRPPADKDDSQVDGVIKFSIEVDDRGDVLRVTKIPGTTISDNTIIEFYRKQVQQLRFVQLDPSKTAASISKGTVTFVIKTN